jgi:phosphate starvation-inducible protein PhoH and related proteins
VNIQLELENPDQRVALFGPADKHLRALREMLDVQIISRDGRVSLSGEKPNVDRAATVLGLLQKKLRRQEWLSENDISEALRGSIATKTDVEAGELDVFSRGRSVLAKTPGQKAYVQAMLAHDLTFCLGPAGTGKTYLAVAVAAHLLKHGRIKRIILARPAVEAGERLGFLPGDLQAKVNPYLRPLFDSLNDMMDFDHVKQLMSRDVIEVVPLAFMRGRTLNESCIILDEAQNTTSSQMLMFLTRLGDRSKMIVTGDPSQIDLPEDTPSGLVDAVRRLRKIKDVARIELANSDIVRHRLVQHIVSAYGDVLEQDRLRRRRTIKSSLKSSVGDEQTNGDADAD